MSVTYSSSKNANLESCFCDGGLRESQFPHLDKKKSRIYFFQYYPQGYKLQIDIAQRNFEYLTFYWFYLLPLYWLDCVGLVRRVQETST